MYLQRLTNLKRGTRNGLWLLSTVRTVRVPHCIELLLNYETILNDFGAFLTSLIPLGNNELAAAFK